MKKLLLLTAVSVLALSVGDAFADTKTQTATVTATIVGAGSIQKTQDMQFGTIVSSASAQTATLSPTGQLSGVTSAHGQPVKAAQFTVSGDTGMAYTLSVADIKLQSGSNSMDLNNFKLLVDDEEYIASTNKITDSADVVKVGADLNIKANQPSGEYNGTITLTMSY